MKKAPVLFISPSILADEANAFVSGRRELHPLTKQQQEAQLMLTNLRDAFIGQSRSPNTVPFHILGIASYCAIVTLSLRCAVFTIFDFKNAVTLKTGLGSVKVIGNVTVR